jgi:hypothetical protein
MDLISGGEKQQHIKLPRELPKKQQKDKPKPESQVCEIFKLKIETLHIPG